MINLNKILENAGIEPKNLQNFIKLGECQRGKPELAMTKAQSILSGGVLSVAIEHTGDLTNRMTHMLAWDYTNTYNAGYDAVGDKVDKVISYLEHKYGFEREFNENLISNAEYYKKDLATLKADVDSALLHYASEHKALAVYNDAQRYGRDAAVALGHKQFNIANNYLHKLKNHLSNPEDWYAYATENLY